jgi:hypothetical protein
MFKKKSVSPVPSVNDAELSLIPGVSVSGNPFFVSDKKESLTDFSTQSSLRKKNKSKYITLIGCVASSLNFAIDNKGLNYLFFTFNTKSEDGALKVASPLLSVKVKVPVTKTLPLLKKILEEGMFLEIQCSMLPPVGLNSSFDYQVQGRIIKKIRP